jgi:glycine/D-amino acid oxidase-like deaminating enzyme
VRARRVIAALLAALALGAIAAKAAGAASSNPDSGPVIMHPDGGYPGTYNPPE